MKFFRRRGEIRVIERIDCDVDYEDYAPGMDPKHA